MCFILLNGSDGIESACSAGDPDLIPGSGRFPWRREWLPTPVFLPGESHGQRSRVDYSPWGHRESDMTERLTLSLSVESCREGTWKCLVLSPGLESLKQQKEENTSTHLRRSHLYRTITLLSRDNKENKHTDKPHSIHQAVWPFKDVADEAISVSNPAMSPHFI